MDRLPPVTSPEGTDSEMLHRLRRETFEYFRREVNPANGLVPDKTQPGSPSSIAAVEMGLSVYIVDPSPVSFLTDGIHATAKL